MGEYQHYFKKKFGQNYIKDTNLLNKILNFSHINSNDLVLEIGTGLGILTEMIATKVRFVYTYEIDEDLKNYLSLKFDKTNVNFINKDFLKEDLSFLASQDYKVIANIPYNISTAILEKIMNSSYIPSYMIFMLQKEYAERISLAPGDKNYGYINVLLNHFFDIKKEFIVRKENFYPVPKVDSMIVSFKKKEYKEINYQIFSDMVKKAFKMKRKTIKNNLSDIDDKILLKILKKYDCDLNARAEVLSYEFFEDLYYNLYFLC